MDNELKAMEKITIILKNGVINIVATDPGIDLEIRDYDIFDTDLQKCEVDENGDYYVSLY